MSQASREAKSSCPSAPPQSDTDSIHIGQPSYGASEEPEAPLTIYHRSMADPSKAFKLLTDIIQSLVPDTKFSFDGKSIRIDWPTDLKIVHKPYSDLPNLVEDNLCAIWAPGRPDDKECSRRTEVALIVPSNTAGNTLEIYERVGAYKRRGDHRMALYSVDLCDEDLKLTGEGAVYVDEGEEVERGRVDWRCLSFVPPTSLVDGSQLDDPG
jgi:hypothetical protein